MTDPLLELPSTLRAELKAPMGRIYTDAATLASDAGDPLVAVGDIVTYHLLEAGRTPAVALIDHRTERSAVDDEISAAIGGFDRSVAATNPPATLTVDLLEQLRSAIAGADGTTTLIEVDGEEDLAALPAILLAPPGASVVYGQPEEGMVLVSVDREATERARSLLSRMDGDAGRLWAILGVE